MGKRGPKRDRVLFVDACLLDDPKIEALSAPEFRAWMRLLCEHVKYGNGPGLPKYAYGASPRRLERFLEIGLLDAVESELHVHGWDAWNGRDAYKRFLGRERVRRLRERRASEM